MAKIPNFEVLRAVFPFSASINMIFGMGSGPVVCSPCQILLLLVLLWGKNPFLSRDAMQARLARPMQCVCVCVSLTFIHSFKTTKAAPF